MKAEWETKTLGDTCEMYQPQTITGKEMVADGAYPVFGANGVIGRYDQFNHEEPQLLITCRGATCGSINISQPKSWITGNAMVVRPKQPFLDLKFLEYLFRGGIDISSAITGAAQPQITRTNLSPLQISYPTAISEQHRIVAILDAAFDHISTARANCEANLLNARAIFESHLQAVFTQRGEPKALGEIAEIQSGGTPTVSQKSYWGGHIPWYSSGELNSTYTTDPERHVTDAGIDNSNAKLFPKGSLLIGMYDTAALKMSILDRDGAFNQAIAAIKPNPKIDVEYILHAINANKPNLLLERRGVRQKNLSLGKIKEIEIPFVKLDLQHEILVQVRKVMAETQRLESLYQRKLQALDDLKKSLLHQAFSGLL